MGKNHTYVSFTDRVASIKIDPVRRSEQKRLAPDSADTASLFTSALERWNELNLSSSYTNFASQCSPLAQSLPMLLYNSRKVFDLLIDAINNSDEHGMEPLMDILVNFSRDLGEDFEPYYSQAVLTCIGVIQRNQKDDKLIETIELAFNCLASMFKFLARLITQNLIPTYDLMLPLFGGVKGQRQRQFILRFAAESMAFLVRRTKGENMLRTVEHIVAKTIEDSGNSQYTMSTTQLLADTLKGPGNTLHSKTPALLEIYYDTCRKLGASNLLSHVLVEALHHVRQDTAGVIYETILQKIKETQDTFAARCLFIITGLRKGDRVADFGPIFESLILLGNTVGNSLEWCQAATAAICFSDTVTMQRHIDALLDTCVNIKVLAKLVESINTFDPPITSLLISRVIKQIRKNIDVNSEVELKTLALLVYDVGALQSNETKLKQTKLINGLKLTDSDGGTSLFNVWWCLLIEPIVDDSLSLLKKLLKLDFSFSETLRWFQSNVIALTLKQVSAKNLSEKILMKIIKFPPTPMLLDSIRHLVTTGGNDLVVGKQELLDTLTSNLDICLMSCDKSVRRSALELIKKLIDAKDDPQWLIDQCANINELPLDLANSRNISHRVRQLASKFNISNQDKKISQNAKFVNLATLSFFMGILTTRLQPVWMTVVEVMPKLAESGAEDLCSKLMYMIEHTANPIDASSFIIDQGISSMEIDDAVAYESVDCNMLGALQTYCEESWSAVDNATDTLESDARKTLEFAHYDDIRMLSIKCLCEISKAAERYVIRDLVPYLLSASDEDEVAESFSFKDKIALLELFAKLKNPQQLPKFPEILEKYLFFLGSRHTPLQQLALKCLLGVNTADVKILRKYRENFEALLDDKRFSDELISFICTGDDQKNETSLHPDDKDGIMPFVIRVLYGRAQSRSKRNLRHAVLSSLLFVEQTYIIMFIKLAQNQLEDVQREALLQQDGDAIMSDTVDEDHDSGMDRDSSRKYQGYLTLMYDFVHRLKGASEACIPMIYENGIFPIMAKISLHDDKALRQLITKTLEEMLSSVPKKSLWESLFPSIYNTLISPQLENYGIKNLENVSTVAKLSLTLSSEKSLAGLIDEKIALAMISCLNYDSVKEPVIISAIKLVINLIDNTSSDSNVVSVAISNLVRILPTRMQSELSHECFEAAVDVVNKMFSLGVASFDQDVVHNLAKVCFEALQKPSRIIPLHVKGSIMQALSQILASPNCDISVINEAYVALAPLFTQFANPEARVHLSSCYEVFGKRVPSYERVGSLIVELNSFDRSRLGEPDFERRSAAFELINENIWEDLSGDEWRPLVFNFLFFIRDPEELALRTNGRYSLLRVIAAPKAKKVIEDHVLPAIKRGLRDEDEKYRRTYIDLLGACASHNILPTLNVLLYRGDEEADFFINVNHVQVHRRRRAIQRLAKVANELDSSVIAHYLLSIVESFAALSGNKNNDLNNLADDALSCITELLRHVSEGQFKSVARRAVKNVGLNPEPVKIRRAIRVVTSVAQATPFGIDEFILKNLVPPLHKILTEKSNEHENLPDRVPISVAIIYFMKSLESETLQTQLPGKLTALCQLLRSKIPEMRDTVRQSLSKIIKALGPNYLLFVVNELSGALNRGGLQSHVLGFTVHSLLVELGREDGLKIGDTDDSADNIFRIVMADTFGSIGEEKDNEGYTNVAKEVKQHKSYDTAEILATWTSLSQFGKLIGPIRSFLSSTKLTSKAEHKVSEVLRRISSGMHRNPQSSTQDAVVMGYEVFSLCIKTLENIKERNVKKHEGVGISGNLAARMAAAKESEEFFTVRLSSRDWYENGGADTFASAADIKLRYAPSNFHLLQAFALDTLRSVLTSTSGGATSEQGKGLLTVSNVKGLLPIILQGFESTEEDMNMAALKLATTALRLPVPFREGDDTLQVMGKRALNFIESSPDTNSLICQSSLKFLTMLLKAKPEFELTAGAIAYSIERLTPDLEEPERQGTAISFLRAIFSRKVMIPQVYDAADALSKIMVTNQSDHIRINCRVAYIQFLSSYPLGQTRLDRHLSALAANLRYPTPTGRLSVMQVITDLLLKINVRQLEGAFIEWYASLVLVLVSDSEPKCREKATEVLGSLISNVKSTEIFNKMIESCLKWLKSLGQNDLLTRGGLETAKMFFVDDVVSSHNASSGSNMQELQNQLNETVTTILASGSRESTLKTDWQLVYLALDNNVSDKMELVEEVLLFPHPWVRARATRVYGHYFKTTPKEDIPLSLLVKVGQKLVRQLGAPRLSSAESLQVVKDLVFIIPIWNENNAKRDDGKSCIEWLVNKLSSMIRTDVSSSEHIGTKTGCIQILASLPSLVSKETIEEVAQEAIRGLFILSDQLAAEDSYEEVRTLAEEAMSFYDQALGTTEYLKRYTAAKRFVDHRRRERKSKRSIEAVTEPELAAQKRMKKNLHKRDVRKQKKQSKR